MIKYKGTTLYPAALFDVLNDFEEISNYVIRLSRDAYGMDLVHVAIVSSTGDPRLVGRLQEEFARHVRVVPEIELTSQESLHKMTESPMSRKAIRLIDERNP